MQPSATRWVLLLGGLAALGLGAPAPGDDKKAGTPTTENRLQAVLGIEVDELPGGKGLRVAGVRANGPATKLTSPATNVRGALEKGDVITAVEGQGFHDLREYFDLVNEANEKGKGRVRLTVLRRGTGPAADWVAAPEVARVDVPAAAPGAARRLPKIADVPPETPALAPLEALKKSK